MSELTQIQPAVSRREALRRIAATVFAAGVAAEMNPADAQHVHAAAASLKGALGEYERKELSEHEWKTVTRMAELIMPADSGGGSAVDAGAVEFIDLLCSGGEPLAYIFHGGLSWTDAEMRQRHSKDFVDCSEAQQKALFDDFVAVERATDKRIAASGVGPYARFQDYQAWDRSDLGAGVGFFDWMRKLAVDAYYTSPIGIKDLGYVGNGAFSSYEVPRKAIDYAMKRSPFKS
ncbi:MAG: hypothetical protein GC160_00720 [Acidobacteria bacterium]|nr:hypothetical protein [Acidobacteriota bacterium]